MTQSSFEVVVVGAGPAGATLALRLARGGRRTALVDSSRFPRQKVCGEYLSAAAWRMLDELGLGSLRPEAVDIDTMRLAVPSGRSIDCPFEPDRRPASLSRWRFDEQLVSAARDAGVTLYLERRVRHVHVVEDAVAGVSLADVHHADDTVEIEASIVVAADGRRSQVVRDTGRLHGKPAGLVGYKRHLRVADMAPFAGVIAMHSLPGGYLGVCPVDSRTINLCGMLPKERLQEARGDVTAALRGWISPRSPIVKLLDGLSERDASPAEAPAGSADESTSSAGPAAIMGIADDDALSRWSTMPDVAPQWAEPLVDGVLYVGDAMRTIEPLTGQGMTIALASARLAADEILSAPRGRLEADGRRRYTQECDRCFGSAVRWSGRFAGMLRSPQTVGTLMMLARPVPGLSRSVLKSVHHRTLTIA